MGSWSVYCGISKIAITAGQECVLLPIKSNKNQSYGYFSHIPATLPIFGEYNDYGGLENIEHDVNTETIEKYFNCTIDEFCAYFTEEVTYQRGEISEENFKNFEEMKDWNFMFIDRKVYDFISTYVNDPGYLNFGNSKILELIGFVRDGNSEDPRFKQKWVFEDKVLHSDERWVQKPNGESIFYFDDEDSSHSLSNLIDIPDDKKWIGTKSMNQLWEYLDDKKVKEMFIPIISGKYYDTGWEQLTETLLDNSLMSEEIKTRITSLRGPKSIVDVYNADIRIYGNQFAELKTLSNNLHPMSGDFEPFKLYITPQCGEYSHHQILLNKFAEINKTFIQEDDE